MLHLWKCMCYYIKNEEETCCDIINDINYDVKELIQYIYSVYNIDYICDMMVIVNTEICEDCNKVINAIYELIDVELIYYTVHNEEHITAREYYEYLK